MQARPARPVRLDLGATTAVRRVLPVRRVHGAVTSTATRGRHAPPMGPFSGHVFPRLVTAGPPGRMGIGRTEAIVPRAIALRAASKGIVPASTVVTIRTAIVSRVVSTVIALVRVVTGLDSIVVTVRLVIARLVIVRRVVSTVIGRVPVVIVLRMTADRVVSTVIVRVPRVIARVSIEVIARPVTVLPVTARRVTADRVVSTAIVRVLPVIGRVSIVVIARPVTVLPVIARVSIVVTVRPVIARPVIVGRVGSTVTARDPTGLVRRASIVHPGRADRVVPGTAALKRSPNSLVAPAPRHGQMARRRQRSSVTRQRPRLGSPAATNGSMMVPS